MGYDTDIAVRIAFNKSLITAEDIKKSFERKVDGSNCFEFHEKDCFVTFAAFGIRYSQIKWSLDNWFEEIVELVNEEFGNPSAQYYGIERVTIGEDLEDNLDEYYGDLGGYPLGIRREIDFGE